MKKPKNIFLTPETIKQVGTMAEKDAHSVKFFIERQVTAMGARGLSYLDLLTQYETTAQKLREVTLNK